MRKNGYTMLEVLLVVSIIGFIASAALVFVQQARERGRIAALLQFSDGIKASLASSPVAYWSFNSGDATDGWGQNHGSLVGNASIDSEIGIVGGALNLSVSNDYVNAGNDSTLDFSGSNAITIEAWILPDVIGAGSYHMIVYQGNWNGFWLRINPSGYLNMEIGNGFNNEEENAIKYPMYDNKWHHVVGTFDGSVMTLYVDGRVAHTKTDITASIGFNGTNLLIGSGHQAFIGLVDEVRLYSEVLPFAQIQKNYAEGVKKFELAVK